MQAKQAGQIWLTHPGSPEVLEYRKVEMPQPTIATLRLRIEASGVIFGDTLARQGKSHPGTPKMPYVLGSEIVGVVDAIGDGVPGVQIGDRVAALIEYGGYATHVIVDAWRCIPVPPSLDRVKIAALGVNYWTAYFLLHHAVQLVAGKRILVHGAAGGLGSALLQVGQLMGLEMYGTASAGKHALIASSGATLIDYRTEDFVARIAELTGDGVDIVYDTIGGDYWARSYRTLRKGGTLVVCGLHDVSGGILKMLPHAARLFFRALLPDGRRVKAVFLSLEGRRESYINDMPRLIEWLESGKIDPLIGAVIPLKQAAEAHRLLESGAVAGKIVLIAEDALD